MPEDLRLYRVPAALPDARHGRLLSVLTDGATLALDRIRPRLPATTAIAAVILGARGGLAPDGRVEVRAAINIDQSLLSLDDDGWTPRDEIQEDLCDLLYRLVPDDMAALSRTVPAWHRRGAIMPLSISARHRVFTEVTADASRHARLAAAARLGGT